MFSALGLFVFREVKLLILETLNIYCCCKVGLFKTGSHNLKGKILYLTEKLLLTTITTFICSTLTSLRGLPQFPPCLSTVADCL